jgi:hypothetical protein
MVLRSVITGVIILLAVCTGSPLCAAETADEGGGLLQGVMDALGAAAKDSLQEQVDEWSGTYEGRLGEVQLVERRGNALTLDVTYDKVKRSDGVYVQGEVLSGGAPIEGFSNTLTKVSHKRGRVRLTITRSDSGQDEWGISTTEVDSDQIKLFLVRETHEDRPFGSIVYDLPKTWNSSSDIETPETAPADEAVIELAEEPEDGAAPPVVTRPVLVGTVLTPVSVRPSTSATIVKPNPSSSISPAASSGGKPSTSASRVGAPTPPTSPQHMPVSRTQIASVQVITVDTYDFYGQAAKAQWRSGAGVLPCPGSASDARGFVRTLPKGTLHAGNAAIQLLQTHPQWIDRGYIAGFYPSMVLASQVHFKTVIGFLKGASNSDGATFTVQVYENGRYQRVFRRNLGPGRYASVDVDLSRWAGKKINLIMRVDAGNNSTQDWAVWVKPRLTR